MAFFLVTMTHPDGDGWGTHVAAHVEYLETLVTRGVLRASGPLQEGTRRAGFLVFVAATRVEVEDLVRADPFSRFGLIESLRIDRWDPLFGCFAAESSGVLAGGGPVGG